MAFGLMVILTKIVHSFISSQCDEITFNVDKNTTALSGFSYVFFWC